ncbi:MAG: hypothetical protein ABIT37_06240 [Luteolibacter sp.]
MVSSIMAVGALFFWQSMPAKKQPFPTGVRVTKIRVENYGTVVGIINYLVCEPDGSTKTFSDAEPFGRFNELIVNKIKQPQVRRYRNEPESESSHFNAEPGITPEDEVEFAALRKYVASKLDVEKLPWMVLGSTITDTSGFGAAKRAGWIDLPK